MASSKNYTEVLIGGKVFTLSGFESEDYLQKVSTYLNHKLDECSNSEGYRKQSAETRSILLALNIADDYFKAKTQVEKLEREIEQKEKEIYDLKHDLISNQIKAESDEKARKELEEQNKELSGLLDLGSQCFENFNFDYYSSVPDSALGVSPRTNMERVYDICQDYAHEFSPKSGNLLLTGGTGLGKTFLSASIARVVSASGHSVVYDTAGHIFARFEAQKFGRDDGENADTAVSRARGCDLLILDDLGTELMTSFVHSAMYQIVNTRLITGKKTVISTNLSPDELGRRYGAPVLSRLQGEYQMLLFFGEDIRRQKRK